MDWIKQPLCLLIIFGAIYAVFELFARRGERKMLISKMAEISSEDAKGVITPYLGLFGRLQLRMRRNASLRWGCILWGIGLGLLIGFYLNYYYEPGTYEAKSVVYTSSVCLFGGMALVISYLIERNEENKGTRKEI